MRAHFVVLLLLPSLPYGCGGETEPSSTDAGAQSSDGGDGGTCATLRFSRVACATGGPCDPLVKEVRRVCDPGGSSDFVCNAEVESGDLYERPCSVCRLEEPSAWRTCSNDELERFHDAHN